MTVQPLGQLRTTSGDVTPGERSSRTLRIRNASVASSFDLRGKRVLDVGCAEGLHSLYMAEHAAEVVGIDHRASVIEIARKTAEVIGRDNTRFLQGDIRTASFLRELGRFDLVVAWGLLHRIADPISALHLMCNLANCLSLEWRTPIIPFSRRISIAYHNPVADRLDPMNVTENEKIELAGAADENKIESSSGFWEPTIGAVRAIVGRNGFNHFKVAGYGERFSSGASTALGKWVTHIYRYAFRRQVSHQIPVGRVHALFWKEDGGINLSDPKNAVANIPSWDLAMTAKQKFGK